MLGAAVFIPRAAEITASLVVDVRWQQGASGGPGRAAELRLNGLAQVLQNMEAVGDLTRLRRAFMRALGKRTAAIAADDLDVRMPLEPVRCRARGTIRQKVDHLPPLQVHDDGPISGALAPRPIIDAHHPNVFVSARRAFARRLRQRRIVSSLVGMPMRFINRSPGRPPTPWPKR